MTLSSRSFSVSTLALALTLAFAAAPSAQAAQSNDGGRPFSVAKPHKKKKSHKSTSKSTTATHSQKARPKLRTDEMSPEALHPVSSRTQGMSTTLSSPVRTAAPQQAPAAAAVVVAPPPPAMAPPAPAAVAPMAAPRMTAASPAPSGGRWLVTLGALQIAPQVKSGDMTAPSFPGTKTDVGPATNPVVGVTWYWNDRISLHMPLAPPFKHNLYGAGAVSSSGKQGSIKNLPPTLLAQWHLLPTTSRFSPYVGAGPTYAYFFGGEGSDTLDALTFAPAGAHTQISSKSKLGFTGQVGATIRLMDRWYLDAWVGKTLLRTSTQLSTGQTIDTTLNPINTMVSIGYRF